VDRTVHRHGVVVLPGRQLPVGMPLAGRRVTLRLEAQLVHVIADGVLWRTVPFTLAAKDRARIQGARLAGPPPTPADSPIRVQRRVSCRGGIQAIGQRVQVGFPHRDTIVTIEVDDTVLRVLDQHDHIIKVVPAPAERRSPATRPTGGRTAPRPRKCHPSDEAKPSTIRWDQARSWSSCPTPTDG